MGGTNNTEQERSNDALYLGRMDNGSSHIVFKLDTKVVVSVNRVVVIPTPQTIIDQVDQMGASESGRITIHGLNLNRADDDDNNSNASDESFVNNEEYQKEFTNNKIGDEGLATDETQEDHFLLLF